MLDIPLHMFIYEIYRGESRVIKEYLLITPTSQVKLPPVYILDTQTRQL